VSWDLTTPEPVSTEAFAGPVSFICVYRSQVTTVFQLNLSVNLPSGKTSQSGVHISARAMLGGYFTGEMHLDQVGAPTLVYPRVMAARFRAGKGSARPSALPV
jgi:hypothetical protein